MKVSFHLSDVCNLNCENCHWFSDEIIVHPEIPHIKYIDWIKQYRIDQVRLTGGEPLLYSEIEELIEKIPSTVNIELFTNGTLISSKNIVDRKNLKLYVGINRDVELSFFEEIKKQYKNVVFISFQSRSNCIHIKDQLKEVTKFNGYIGKQINCLPKMIRFGTDGKSYFCETGLRTKKANLQLPFSLFEGIPILPINHLCQVSATCLSNFTHEQNIEW